MIRPRPIRILLAKAGLDGHDRGLGVIARALRDSGMEVVYLGIHQTPEAIVRAAVEEQVDVVALSVLSGAHMTLFPAVYQSLKQAGMDVLITGGGIIPADDKRRLESAGIGRLFEPGDMTREIVAYIRGWHENRVLAGEEAPGKAKPRKQK
jgi:methylmalonyl-CoA mutase C-terminal domain/subunit